MGSSQIQDRVKFVFVPSGVSPIPFRATVTRIATARGGLVSFSLRGKKGTSVHELQLDYELESSFLLAKSERGAGKLTTLLRGE